MAVEDARPERATDRASWVNDPKVRGAFYQILLVLALAWLIWEIIDNTRTNLEQRNMATGWGFLDETAGFGIILNLIQYSEISNYGRALFVGFLNTLLVAGIGVFLATVIGFIVGIARLSKNWVISRIAYVYIEVLRNIPLLLQIFFWYFAVLRAVPGKREMGTIVPGVHLNIAGLRAPAPVFEEGSTPTVIALILAIVISFVIKGWSAKRQAATGQRFPVLWTAIGLIVVLPLIVFLATGMPISISYPEFRDTGPMLMRGFQEGTGFVLIPEFLSLLLALSLYTATFIAEIVRAGILAVSHGQTEASYALGLRPGSTLRLVIIPQAMRVIIPPLTSQYLNLTKNSSLAVAIAYPDLVSVGGTVLNQTGQAIEIIAIWMLVYLSISLLTSAFMNWYNKRMALVER